MWSEINVKPSWSETTVRAEKILLKKYPIGTQILTWNVTAFLVLHLKDLASNPQSGSRPYKKDYSQNLMHKSSKQW